MFFNLYGPGVVNPKVGTVDAMALQNVCMTVLLMASYSFITPFRTNILP